VEALGRIRKGTHRLERLVANLLEVTRIEARRSVSVIPTELDIPDVIARVVDEVQESWPDRTILVDTQDTAWRATGSLLSVERILINLLSNALTYAPTGPVSVRIAQHESGAGIAITVTDEGPGVPLHEQKRIFERFERLDTTNQQAGTGLGLYIARGLATNMAAELTLKSEPGSGAEFTLRLPAVRRRPALVDLTA
jgi:signal transduction histidine kinase